MSTTGSSRVPIDKRKIRSVLVNLVQNAIEASPANGTIALGVDGDRDAVRFRCRDQGPGLDPAVAERVLEPGVTTKSTGSGLGLTIARTLVHQHQGDLELRDADGLEVVVTLPRR